jgi:16S rRNA (uracil1498-N3)-methyltransferase
MTTHRFFVQPDSIAGQEVIFGDATAHQICNVLRMGPGERVLVLDNSGWEYEVILDKVKARQVVGRVVAERLATGEPRTKITLYQGMLKGRHFEWVLQKGTELGIVEFVPLISERCIVADLEDVEKKRWRWERIIAEAAEQSRRGRLPWLQPALIFPAACERAKRMAGLVIIPWEEERSRDLRSALSGEEVAATAQPRKRPFSISLFVGPEGGFTPGEVSLAAGYGAVPVSLGPRILRAETAGIVVAAAILFDSGDLQPE